MIRIQRIPEQRKLLDALIETEPKENQSRPMTATRILLTHRMWAKVMAFILTIVMLALAVGSVVAGVVMIEQDIYTTSERGAKDEVFRNIAEGDVLRLIHMVNPDHKLDGQDAVEYLSERNVASVEMTFSEGPHNNWGYDGGKTGSNYEYQITVYHMKSNYTNEEWYSLDNDYVDEEFVELDKTEAIIVLSNAFHENDDYYFSDLLISTMYAMRYWVYVVGIVSIVLAIVCFVFLMCASGRRKGFSEPQPGWGTKIPFDVLAVATGFSSFLTIQLGYELLFDHGTGGVMLGLLYGLCLMAVAAVLLGFCMSFALRIKLGSWWKNTVVVYALRLCWHLLRKLGTFFRVFGKLLLKIPMIWKTALLIIGICIYNFFVLIIGLSGDEGWMVIFLVLEAIVLIPAVLYAALMLRKLYQSSQALAAGDLSYQIDTKRLFLGLQKGG